MVDDKERKALVVPPEVDELLEETDEKRQAGPVSFFNFKWFASYLVVFILTLGLLITLSARLGAWNFSSIAFGSWRSRGGAEEAPDETAAGKWDSYSYKNLKGQRPLQSAEAGAGAQGSAGAPPGEAVSLDPSQIGSTELKGKCGFEQFEPSGQEQGVRVIAGPMTQFGSLYKLFKAAGLSANEGAALLKAMEKLLDVKVVRAEDQVVMHVKEEGNAFLFLELRRSKTTIFHFLKTSDGGIDAHQVQFPTRKEWAKAGGVVHASLYRSAEKAGLDGSIASEFMEVLGAYINFTEDTREGDLFKVIAASEWIGDKFISYDPPQAVYYKGVKAGEITAIRFPPEADSARYYKPDGMSLKEVLSEVPLKTLRVSSPFNLKRFHPILKVIKPHTGVDFAAPKGTPIYAYADGVVKVARPEGAMGNMIQVDHGGGISTYYGHLNGFASGIKSGVSVKRAQLIGYVGTTGRSTGPHLHFGYKKNNAWLDPMKFLSVKTTSEQMIDASLQGAFFKRARTMLAFLASIGTDEEEGAPEEKGAAEAEEAKEEDKGAGKESEEEKKKGDDWDSEW